MTSSAVTLTNSFWHQQAHKAATAENEEQYTLSNLIYIAFQNVTLFFEVFFQAGIF